MIYLVLTWLAAPILWCIAARRRRPTNRVLVIQTAKIGDFIATTPVFRALRIRHPGMEIVALLHPVNIPLAKQLDTIDRIVTLPKHGFKGWNGKRWLLKQLAEGYDGVLILSPNLTNLLVPFWVGVPKRVSVLADRRRGSVRLAWPFLTHGEPHRVGQLFRETALRALVGLGVNVDAALLALPNEARGVPNGMARLDKLPTDKSRPLVGFGLGAGNRMKALDPSQIEAFASQIIKRTESILVLIGTEADRATADTLSTYLQYDRVVDTTGQWPLDELPILLKALDCFVGVDSGATYLADALGVPVVDFMGPADAADQRPIGKRAIVIHSTEPCAPCSHAFDAPYACRFGTRACIAHAPIERLVDEVLRILKTQAEIVKVDHE
ncbi:glycosyltransferase family 9 protein [Dechloromonas sp. XY25]|uniref:Glycosyltransferase family 9 protein n=1 Tax=Dechloromonas hankyongensis TaxID=2908002 RepID=A0ABS9JYJ1_9RHOO|nr:glycosyltransferase family 9 protein [Dechloromonas hankyongensis]MCG2575982.1 glycosyltransferase family 9 protein [Dechloromonas hankyongensis]